MKNASKEWKTSEVEFLQDNIDFLTWAEMSQHLGRKATSVGTYASATLKLKKEIRSYGNQWMKAEDDLLRKFAGTKTMAELSDLLPRTELAIRRRIMKLAMAEFKKAA